MVLNIKPVLYSMQFYARLDYNNNIIILSSLSTKVNCSSLYLYIILLYIDIYNIKRKYL